MNQPQQVVITRGTIGLIGSVIAAAGILLTGMVLLWQSGFSGYAALTLGATAAGVIIWAIATPDEFRNFITGRQVRRSITGMFATVLLIAIVTLGYVIIERAVLTLDMTESQNFTLSEQSLEVLREVTRPIQITAFYTPQDAAIRETDDQFFRLYEVATDGRVRREYVDPVEQPVFALSFPSLTSPTGGAVSGDVYISYINDDGTIDPRAAMPVALEGRQEREMTQSILRLLAAGDFTVYFSVDHGELNPGVVDGTGIALVGQLLTDNGIQIAPIQLKAIAAAGQDIPLDASAVIIARPQEDFSAEVVRVLDRYLDGGGGLFITTDLSLSDTAFLREDSPFNTYLWDSWGLRVRDAVIVDRLASDPTPVDLISYAVFDSQIASRVDPADPEFRAEFRIARPIEVDETPPVTNGNVIMSSPESFGETDLDTFSRSNDYQWTPDADIQGPLTIAAWARDEATDGEIVLIGDSDFLSDGFITRPPGNSELFTGGIGWMTGFQERVSFGFQGVAGASPLIFVSTQELDQIAFATIFTIPALLLALGFSVWFVRARR